MAAYDSCLALTVKRTLVTGGGERITDMTLTDVRTLDAELTRYCLVGRVSQGSVTLFPEPEGPGDTPPMPRAWAEVQDYIKAETPPSTLESDCFVSRTYTSPTTTVAHLAKVADMPHVVKVTIRDNEVTVLEAKPSDRRCSTYQELRRGKFVPRPPRTAGKRGWIPSKRSAALQRPCGPPGMLRKARVWAQNTFS